MKKVFLVLILVLAFGLRLYRLNFPLADWHSWRQADTSAVSRNFVKNGFDILHPRFDDLSNVASGLKNPEGYRFVEFPFYNLLQAGFYKFLPLFSLEVWGRLVSIFVSSGSLIFLYLIVKKYLNTQIALLSAFFFAVLPFNVYYSRVILPEPLMVFASLGIILFFEKKLLFCLFAALAFLLKPYLLIFLLPIAYLNWKKWRFNYLKWLFWAILVLISLLPFFFWRRWMNNFPEGVPAYDWLFNMNNIRFRGAWFYWLFAERIAKLILGYWGIILFGLGLIAKPGKKEGLFFHSWLVAILAYFVIIAAGNVQHDYYQVIAVPIICVFLAKGAHFLLSAVSNKTINYLVLAVSCLFMFAFSWYQVRDFFNINNSVLIEAGRAADRVIPKDAKVIAPYGGDTSFLYQTNRRGWPVGIEIEKIIALGAEYYVNFNFGPETDWLEQTYCVLEKTPKWVIIDLKCAKK